MAFHGPSSRLAWVVRCKGCQRPVAAGVAALPGEAVVVRCALCGEHRRYLPAELYQGRLAFELIEGGTVRGG